MHGNNIDEQILPQGGDGIAGEEKGGERAPPERKRLSGGSLLASSMPGSPGEKARANAQTEKTYTKRIWQSWKEACIEGDYVTGNRAGPAEINVIKTIVKDFDEATAEGYLLWYVKNFNTEVKRRIKNMRDLHPTLVGACAFRKTLVPVALHRVTSSSETQQDAQSAMDDMEKRYGTGGG